MVCICPGCALALALCLSLTCFDSVESCGAGHAHDSRLPLPLRYGTTSLHSPSGVVCLCPTTCLVPLALCVSRTCFDSVESSKAGHAHESRLSLPLRYALHLYARKEKKKETKLHVSASFNEKLGIALGCIGICP